MANGGHMGTNRQIRRQGFIVADTAKSKRLTRRSRSSTATSGIIASYWNDIYLAPRLYWHASLDERLPHPKILPSRRSQGR
jgi:hypothetical protein